MPRPRAAPGNGSALGRRPAACSLAGSSALPLRLEDLGDRAALRFEELVIHLVPAPELADLEERRRSRKLVRARYALDHRPVPLAHEDLLGLGGVQEVDERLGRLWILRLARDGDRILDQNRLVRDDIVELLALLLGQDRLVLVAEQHIALAAREGLERLPGVLVEHRYVLE